MIKRYIKPVLWILSCLAMTIIFDFQSGFAQEKSILKDSLAENMLIYQRSIGGWPKAVNEVKVDYSKLLTDDQKRSIKSDSLHNDATIDNSATTKEVRYLVKAYKQTTNRIYLASAEKGLRYLFKAQYANGGWPQYYPDARFYYGQITYNDNAMINVLNILQDLTLGMNDFDAVDHSLVLIAETAIKKGVDCILKTQVKVNGKLTVWCAQYDKESLLPVKARAYELVSLSGMESVNIVEFLMRIKNPSPEIKQSIVNAINWFDAVKIKGYKFVDINDASQPKGKGRVLVADPQSIIWARFYDIKTNQPFFTGRDGIIKKTVAEIEIERRTGYAWYGTWPASLISKKYPKWLKSVGG